MGQGSSFVTCPVCEKTIPKQTHAMHVEECLLATKQRAQPSHGGAEAAHKHHSEGAHVLSDPPTSAAEIADAQTASHEETVASVPKASVPTAMQHPLLRCDDASKCYQLDDGVSCTGRPHRCESIFPL